jgi:hypothetical protein
VASFSDDFNRANSTDLGAGWVEVSGDWSIISNQLSSGSAGGTIILRAAGAMATSDHSVQMTIAATAAVSHGVWARGNANITQGYLLRNDGTSWNLFSVVGGSFTSIGSYAAAAVAGDVVKLQVVGTAIKGYINGTLRISVTDSAVTTGTSVGVRAESTSSLRFDDFTAADVVNGATLGIASATETAQTLTGSKTTTLSVASATEAAQQLVASKTVTLGIASETDGAQALVGTKTATLVPVVEQDTAQALVGVKAGALGAAGSVEAAQPLASTVTATLAAAGSVETALPLVGVKTAVLTPALEVDTARPLTVPSTTVPSPERTLMIPAERRRLTVAAESRTLAVAAEPRTLIIRR